MIYSALLMPALTFMLSSTETSSIHLLYSEIEYRTMLTRNTKPGLIQVSIMISHRRLFVNLSNNTSTLKMGAKLLAQAPLSGQWAFPVVTHSRALLILVSRSNRSTFTRSGGLNDLLIETGFHFYALLRRHQIQSGENPLLLLLEDAPVEMTTLQGVMLQAGRSPWRLPLIAALYYHLAVQQGPQQ